VDYTVNKSKSKINTKVINFIFSPVVDYKFGRPIIL